MNPIIMPFPNLHVPQLYGAHGEVVEGLPPPSPRQSLSRSGSRSSLDLRMDVRALYTHRRIASNASTSSQHSQPPHSSPPPPSRTLHSNSPLGRGQGHHRRTSSSSVASWGATRTGFAMSRSSSTKSIAELHNDTLAQQRQLQLEIQRLRLSEQNAELENKLQDLEEEVTRADMLGRKKLRRLDKELTSLKQELENALERNKELEEKLLKRQTKNSSTSASSPVRAVSFISETEGSNVNDTVGADPTDSMAVLPDTDFDNVGILSDGLGTSVSATAELDNPEISDFTRGVPFTSLSTGELVSQLLLKISELQDANSHIASHKEALSEKLSVASRQFDDMKRKYEFLEERVIEAEIRNHRILELEDGGVTDSESTLAIEWHQDEPHLVACAKDSASPATKLQRKAMGNRPRMEHYRRLSSLYGSYSGSDVLLNPSAALQSLSHGGTHGPNNSRQITPSKSSGNVLPLPHSASSASRLSVSPAKSSSSSTSHGRSRAGSFFDTTPAEDIISAMQRQLREQKEALARDQEALAACDEDSLCQQEDLSSLYDEQSLWDLPATARSRHQSLASEIGSQWNSPIAANGPDGQASETVTDISPVPLHRQHLDQSLQSVPSATVDKVVLSFARFREQEAEEQQQLERIEEDDSLASLMPDGPADAQTYDDLQAALQDVEVKWEDDQLTVAHGGMKRITGSAAFRTETAPLSWTYEDAESDNSENDPWKDEHSARDQAIETPEQVQAREKAEARALKRRKRLEELAQKLLEDENEETHSSFNNGLALVRVESAGSDESETRSRHLSPSSSQEMLNYEDASTDKQPGGRGIDYWPVSRRARYSPNVVAMRVQKTSQEYINMCLLWTKFLVVLAVAVIFSLWRGPEAGLGIGRRSRKRVERSKAPNEGDALVLRTRGD